VVIEWQDWAGWVLGLPYRSHFVVCSSFLLLPPPPPTPPSPRAPNVHTECTTAPADGGVLTSAATAAAAPVSATASSADESAEVLSADDLHSFAESANGPAIRPAKPEVGRPFAGCELRARRVFLWDRLLHILGLSIVVARCGVPPC